MQYHAAHSPSEVAVCALLIRIFEVEIFLIRPRFFLSIVRPEASKNVVYRSGSQGALMQAIQLVSGLFDSNIQSLHTRALAAARGFQKAECELVDALMAVDREKTFLKLGYPSLYVYATQALNLSESVAYAVMAVARKAREVPELREAIHHRDLSVSKAKKIVSVLTAANQGEWLKKAETLSTRELEKEVARENPKEATPERASYVSAERLALSLGVSEELMKKLRRAQDQVCRSRRTSVSLEQTLEDVVAFYLWHKDPLEKSLRVVARKDFSK